MGWGQVIQNIQYKFLVAIIICQSTLITDFISSDLIFTYRLLWELLNSFRPSTDPNGTVLDIPWFNDASCWRILFEISKMVLNQFNMCLIDPLEWLYFHLNAMQQMPPVASCTICYNLPKHQRSTIVVLFISFNLGYWLLKFIHCIYLNPR